MDMIQSLCIGRRHGRNRGRRDMDETETEEWKQKGTKKKNLTLYKKWR